MQKTITWVLSLALTIIICGYGICLVERGVHRMLAKPAMMGMADGMHMDHHDMTPPSDSMHHGMMSPGCCADSVHAKEKCGMEHGGMACGDGHMGRGGMGGMECCDGHMGMMRMHGPPPLAGQALTAMIGALVLVVGAVFGMVTLRQRAEKS